MVVLIEHDSFEKPYTVGLCLKGTGNQSEILDTSLPPEKMGIDVTTNNPTSAIATSRHPVISIVKKG